MNHHLSTIDGVSFGIQLVLLAFALGLPIRHIIKTGRFFSAVLFMWLYLFLWTVVICTVLPLFLALVFRPKNVFEHVPDGMGLGAALLVGWLPSIMLCGAVSVLREFWIQFRSRSS